MAENGADRAERSDRGEHDSGRLPGNSQKSRPERGELGAGWGVAWENWN